MEFDKCQILEFVVILDDTSNPKDLNKLSIFNAIIYNLENYYSGNAFALNTNRGLLNEIDKIVTVLKRNLDDFGYHSISTEKVEYFSKKEDVNSGNNDECILYYRDLSIKYIKHYLMKENLTNVFQDWLYLNLSKEDIKYGLNIVGESASIFDIPFCKSFFPNFDKVKINNKMLDIGSMYFESSDKQIPSLQTCLERAGINVIVNNTAIVNALNVIELIRHKMK